MKIAVNILSGMNCYHRNILITLIVLNTIKYTVAYPQQRYTTFSTIHDYSVGNNCINLLKGDFNGDHIDDIASFGRRNLSILYAVENSHEYTIKPYIFESSIIKAATADINNDGNSDLAFLFSNPMGVKIYLSKLQDTIVFKWKYNLEQMYDEIQLSDLSGDGKADLILFGKSVAGITVFLGNGDGSFKYPQNILSDYSFSSIHVFDFQGDNLPDLIATSWITNEIMLFTAYAKLRYSLPATMPFADEPVFVFPTFLNSDEYIDLVISFKDKFIMETYFGDGFGNFSKLQNMKLLFPPDKTLVADLNNSGSVEIILFNKEKKYYSVWKKDDDGIFIERTVYSAGKQPDDIQLFRHQTTPYYNIVLSNSFEKKVSVILNSGIPISHTSSIRYITGIEPSAITTVDLNHDGYLSLLVANRGSRSLSLFKNTDGIFDGPINFNVAIDNPITLNVLQLDKNRFVALTTHQNSPQLSISEVKTDDYSFSTYSIMSLINPVIFGCEFPNEKKLLNFQVASAENINGYYRIFTYNQIAKTKYTEQEITKIFTNNIVGVTSTVDSENERKGYYFVKSLSNNTYQFVSTQLDKQKKVIEVGKYFTYKDSSSGNAAIYLQDLNKDDKEDVVIYSPGNLELYLSKNIGDSTYSSPYQKIKNIKLNNRNDLQFIDIDNDKKLDIVVSNSHTRTLQAYLGKGDGSFSAQNRLMSIEGISGMAINDFNKDGIPDFALIYDKEGYLKIIFGQQ